jgi:N-acetylglucosamine kinase-like BadF-type ATPase
VSAAPQDGAPPDGLVVAVDGGQFKTDIALLHSSGRLVSLVRGPGSNPHFVGVESCVELLEGVLESAIARANVGAPSRPLAATAQVLLAGADLPEERETLHAAIGRLRWSEHLVVDNDTLALLRAGTDRGWGIAVVCGAGINCIGLAPDGREVRFPALGDISGDWGGGADVGMAALAAAARSADARGPRTALETAVPTHFGLSDPREVSRAVHLRQISKVRLGELAPVVFGLCNEDPVAAGIVLRLADEVIAFASAAIRRLDLTGEDPDVVLGGSVLKALSPSVVKTITSGVQEVATKAHILVSPSEPIVGAALLGLDALAADASASDRARSELDAGVAALYEGRVQRGRQEGPVQPVRHASYVRSE